MHKDVAMLFWFKKYLYKFETIFILIFQSVGTSTNTTHIGAVSMARHMTR